MPKIEVIRRGAKRPVKVHSRVAAQLVKSGGFDYVTAAPVPKSKREAKAKHAQRPANAEGKVEAKEEAKVAAAQPLTAKSIALAMTRAELEELTKPKLQALASKHGVSHVARDSKDTLVDKLFRYMRRDMRAER